MLYRLKIVEQVSLNIHAQPKQLNRVVLAYRDDRSGSPSNARQRAIKKQQVLDTQHQNEVESLPHHTFASCETQKVGLGDGAG